MAHCITFLHQKETFDGLHMPQQPTIFNKQFDSESAGYSTMGQESIINKAR